MAAVAQAADGDGDEGAHAQSQAHPPPYSVELLPHDPPDRRIMSDDQLALQLQLLQELSAPLNKCKSVESLPRLSGWRLPRRPRPPPSSSAAERLPPGHVHCYKKRKLDEKLWKILEK